MPPLSRSETASQQGQGPVTKERGLEPPGGSRGVAPPGQHSQHFPNDPYAAVGAAFCIFKLAQRIVEAPKHGDGEKRGLIQLLS